MASHLLLNFLMILIISGDTNDVISDTTNSYMKVLYFGGCIKGNPIMNIFRAERYFTG